MRLMCVTWYLTMGFVFALVACSDNAANNPVPVENVVDSLPVDSVTNPSIDGLSFVDERDGQRYRIVTIGEQTWLAENLNYAMDSSWCYANDPANCALYGRFYEWNAANKACPVGWRLPNDEDWAELLSNGDFSSYEQQNQTVASFRSTTGWEDGKNGTDIYGFSALPAGFHTTDGSFIDNGYEAVFWSASFTQESHPLDGELVFASMCEFKASFSVADEPRSVVILSRFNGLHYNVRCLRN